MAIVTEAGFYDGKFLKSGQFHKAEDETVATGVGGSVVDYDAKTKDELVALAKDRGVQYAATATKADIIAALKAAN